jgi:hypothetical protein
MYLLNYSITPKISLSLMIRYSSPSTFTSLPAYCPKRTVSPALTLTGITSPVSVFLPGPTDITSP